MNQDKMINVHGPAIDVSIEGKSDLPVPYDLYIRAVQTLIERADPHHWEKQSGDMVAGERLCAQALFSIAKLWHREIAVSEHEEDVTTVEQLLHRMIDYMKDAEQGQFLETPLSEIPINDEPGLYINGERMIGDEE